MPKTSRKASDTIKAAEEGSDMDSKGHIACEFQKLLADLTVKDDAGSNKVSFFNNLLP